MRSFGTIKAYYPLKGYGFITREKGKDLFFHRTDVIDESALIEGVPVKFHIADQVNGKHAVEISREG